MSKQTVACPLRRPSADRAEHDLVRMEGLLKRLLDGLPSDCPVGFTAAMHGLVLLDEKGHPLNDCVAWADSRSVEQARRLKRDDPDVQRRTGTPLHPMAWPAKVLWFQEQESELWSRVARCTDLKGYLLERCTGVTFPLDVSGASATGLWNAEEERWDSRLVESLKLGGELLPRVELDAGFREWKGRRVYSCAGDGPIGNLGVGAVTGGRIAVSVGTSGAVRQIDDGGTSFQPALFRYALDRRTWVRGGAISNGTSTLDWLQTQGGKELDEILRLAEDVRPGAEGVRVYPYFSGERAPFWEPDVESHIIGWSFQHQFAHLARATIEGVAFCLRRLTERLSSTSEPLRCTGGFFNSPLWRQLLADVTGRPIAVSPVEEATALGAALMACDNYLERSADLPLGPLTKPARASEYEELYRRWLRDEPTLR